MKKDVSTKNDGGEAMNVRHSISVLVLFFFLVGSLPVLGHAADQNRQSLENLLADLEKKIKEADQRKVANPKFLEELRALVKQYRSTLRVVCVSEDLADGEYRNNPTWIVGSGRFQVTGARRLHSEVPVEPPAPPPSSERPSALGTIFKEILGPTTEEGKGRGTPSTPVEARIHTLADIGPNFEVDLTVVSRSSRGSMEVVLLGGAAQAIPLYRMVYQASPSSERPIQIIRERDGKSYLIDAASQYPSLDDGVPHRVQWIRTSQGQMRVLVDGKEALSTYENYYRSTFSGLALVNKGGTYEWGPITVLQAIEAKTQ